MFTQTDQPALSTNRNSASQPDIDPSPEELFRVRDKDNHGLLPPRECPLDVINRNDDDGDQHISFEELRKEYEKRGEALYDTPDAHPAPLKSLDDLRPRRPPLDRGVRNPKEEVVSADDLRRNLLPDEKLPGKSHASVIL